MAEKKTGGVGKKAAATSGKQTKKKPATKTAKKSSTEEEKKRRRELQNIREEKRRQTVKNVKKSRATQNDTKKKVVQKKSPEKLSDIYTSSGVRLTVREAKFIDRYIETGNGRQAVIDAGYTGLPSPVANKLLKKDYIALEIQDRMSRKEESSIADRAEIMQFWTDMMRGKILDQFDMPTTNSDKLKAAAELAKRGMDIEDRIKERKEVGTAPEIKISLSWDKEGEQ